MQDTKIIEEEPQIRIGDLATYKERLMRILLITVIVVNLLVLLSIILSTYSN